MAESPGSPASVLHIHRLRSQYLVARDHPFPEGVRSNLDGVVRHQLENLSRVLEPLCSVADESLWVIRRLDVEVAVDATWEPERIARPWAAELGRSLQRILNAGERCGEVLRFPNRAAFLARFVTDLAEGSAWEDWYYDSFDSLRSLPTETAICEALARDASVAEAALHLLSDEGCLEKVLSRLSPANVWRIVHACGAHAAIRPSSCDARQIINTLLDACREAHLASPYHPADALRLYLAISRRSPAVSAAGLSEALDHFVTLAEFVRAEADCQLLDALSRGDFDQAIQAARSSALGYVTALEYFQEAAKGDPQLIARTITVLRRSPRPGGLDGLAGSQYGQSLESFCGGAFLLLRPLIDSGIHRLIESVAPVDPGTADAADAWRWLVLVKCLGREHALRNAEDSALAFVAGLNRPPDSWETIRASSEDSNRQLHWRNFVMVLGERERIETRCWLAELVHEGSRILVIRDLASDEWLWAGLVSPDAGAAADTLECAVEFLRVDCGLCPEYMFLDPILSREIHGTGAECFDIVLPAEPATGQPADINKRGFTLWNKNGRNVPTEERDLWARQLLRFVPGETDLDYLRLDSLGLFCNLEPTEDLFWSVATRAVLKDFARRLIGFDQSSCSFLQRNFLGTPASVRVAPGADDVKEIQVLLQQPPLYLVLNIAGMDGEAFTVPWIQGERVTLNFSRS
jgi:hypothetical protein